MTIDMGSSDAQGAQDSTADEAKSLRNDIVLVCDALRAAARGDMHVAPVGFETSEGSDLGDALELLLEGNRSGAASVAVVVQKIQADVALLHDNIAKTGHIAEDASEKATEVCVSAKDVHSSIESVSAGAEQMTTSIVEISRNASRAADVARAAVSAASDANSAIKELGASSEEIGKVIRTITAIAQQTNLLALNAHIEAARAGEAGKGFAVVANEVKELAKETASATQDIGGKIEAIQGTAAGVVDAISRINTIIEQISESQSAIASAVEEQSVVTSEISRSVAHAARGSESIAHSLADVSDRTETTATDVDEARGVIEGLVELAQDAVGHLNRHGG